MKISHVAMYVNNLEQMKSFYKKYFFAKSNEIYHNSKTGLKTYFLTFDDDSKLELMTRPNIKQIEKEMNQLGFTHLAFSIGTKENVDILTETLKNDGYTILSEPRLTGDGYYESCILDPENNQIEITI